METSKALEYVVVRDSKRGMLFATDTKITQHGVPCIEVSDSMLDGVLKALRVGHAQVREAVRILSREDATTLAKSIKAMGWRAEVLS